MTAQWILLGFLPIVAGIALLQSRRLSALIGMGLFSFLLAAAYLLMHAPDVAITEATIGAALVTAIYVLAIRRTGRLIVVADEVPGLMAREGDRITGLEYEILAGFAREIGLDLTVRFVPMRRIHWLLSHGEADLGAGGLISSAPPTGVRATPPHLETGLFSYSAAEVSDENEETAHPAHPDYEGYFVDLADHGRHQMLPSVVHSLDLARVLALSRRGIDLEGLTRRDGTFAYGFLVSENRQEIARDYANYLQRLRSSGRLDAMIRRYVV